MVENIPKQRDMEIRCGLTWRNRQARGTIDLGKSTRVDHLQSTRDKRENGTKDEMDFKTVNEDGVERWQRAQRSIFDSTPTQVNHQCSQCWTMISKTVLMAMVLLKIVDRQEKHKSNLFPNNYNNISTSLFAVFATTIYLVEIVMLRKKTKWGEMWLASTVDGLPWRETDKMHILPYCTQINSLV